MIRTIRAEFLKLFTIRSTYITVVLAMALVTLVCFYFEGYRGVTGSAASTLQATALREIVSNTAGVAAIFISIISILLMAHEYRYNTIMYTLTANTHRTSVLLSKSLAIIIFGALIGIALVGYGLACYMLGLALRDAVLPVQDFHIWYLLGKVSLYFTCYALVGLLIASVSKSVVGAIVFFFIAPMTVEPLLALFLKQNAAYLPFTMFDSIVGSGLIKGDLSTTRIITFSLLYLVITWMFTWVLFLKRDAN